MGRLNWSLVSSAVKRTSPGARAFTNTSHLAVSFEESEANGAVVMVRPCAWAVVAPVHETNRWLDSSVQTTFTLVRVDKP